MAALSMERQRKSVELVEEVKSLEQEIKSNTINLVNSGEKKYLATVFLLFAGI